MVVSISFKELGAALHREQCWWTIAVARRGVIQQAVGGLRDLLKLTLCPPSGMQSAGLPMALCGKPAPLFAKVGTLLSDGDGLRMGLQWLGSAGTKPCFRHWNVLMKNSGRAQWNEKYIEIDCHDPSKFRTWRNADLAKAVDVCVEAFQQQAAGEMSKKALKETQQALGFKATPDGLLADRELRCLVDFMGVLRYDWPHTFLADGVVGGEIWALLAAGKMHGLLSQEAVHLFLQEGWQVPWHDPQRNKDLSKLFAENARKANEEHAAVKCSMSELLGLYALLRHFVEVRAPQDPRIAAAVHNFMLACKDVDLVLAAKRKRVPVSAAGRQLAATMEQLLRGHTSSHGNSLVKPKFHWAFDIAEGMVQDDHIMDSFVIERLHLRAKSVATHCKKLGDYERSVMSGIMNNHMNKPDSDGVRMADLGWPRGTLPGMPHVTIADACDHFGMRIHVGDFCFRGAAPGRIEGRYMCLFVLSLVCWCLFWTEDSFFVGFICFLCVVGGHGSHMARDEELAVAVACCREDSECYLVVDKASFLSPLSQHSNKWGIGAPLRAVWPMKDVVGCVAWKVEHEVVTAIML